MANARTARPVSGEIMTGMAMDALSGRVASDVAPESTQDIIDADYEVLSYRSDRAPPVSPAQRAAPIPLVEGMDMLRKPDTAPVRRRASRGGPIFWISGVSATLAAFWVSGGHALVRQTQLFSVDRPAGAMFSISGVTSHVDASGTKPVLFVEGGAANDGAGTLPLPPLEIKVTGNDNRITRYTLGTAGQSLAPGERFAFSSRLDVPKNGVKTISVVFAE